MELKDFVLNQLNGLQRNFSRTLNGLTQFEVMWRPAAGCNSIGLIYYHCARFEDSFIQARLQGKPELWVSEGWSKKLNLPVEDVGAHYTVDQVNAFPVPPIADIIAYADAARVKTVEYLNKVTPAELDKKMSMPRGGETSVAGMLSMLVIHPAEHAGEMAYLRGLLRGMDK